MSKRLTKPSVDHVVGDLRQSLASVQSELALDIPAADLIPGIQGALGLVQTTHLDCILRPGDAPAALYRRLLTLAALAVHAAHQEARAIRAQVEA